MGIYFEYAFLRDLWFNIEKQEQNRETRNQIKRNTILEFLKPTNAQELRINSIYDFNNYFGAVPRPSSTDIQSPGNWSIRFYDQNIPDNDEFLRVCQFKWCFNAKPDIVIHTSHDSAICIEAKFESLEGKYPSNDNEKKIFSTRHLESVGQLSIQKKIMDELLGIKTHYIFLIQNKTQSDTYYTYTWKEIFSNLDTSGSLYFVLEWLKRTDINCDL